MNGEKKNKSKIVNFALAGIIWVIKSVNEYIHYLRIKY